MTINDIKPGYLVQLRDGKLHMVMQTTSEPVLVTKSGLWCTLKGRSLGGNDDLAIIKVYGYCYFAHKALNISTEDRELLWEHKEKKTYTYAQLR